MPFKPLIALNGSCSVDVRFCFSFNKKYAKSRLTCKILNIVMLGIKRFWRKIVYILSFDFCKVYGRKKAN